MRGAAPRQQQLDDVQVVVMDGHVQGSQAVLREGGGKRQREQPSLSGLSSQGSL